jgi:hypothetical protein
VPETGEITPARPSPPVAILMFLAFFACGAAVLALATGVLSAPPGALEAPRWVIGCLGAVFMAGALVPLNATFSLPGWVNQLVALTVGVGLAMAFNWVAFFPGERHFTGAIAVPGMQLSAPTSQTTGRIMFGLGALLADALVLAGLWRQMRLWVRAARQAKP